MTVALTMIVKDEAHHIEQALGSVKELVDKWFILDTGSTDGTQEIVRESMDGASGRLLEREWCGFADARTAVLREAMGSADWLLMMDADMTTVIHPGFKSWLESDPDVFVTAWQLTVTDRDLNYRLPWLLRGQIPWEYQGVTHSYLVAQGKQRPVTGLRLEHHGEYDPGKFERDAGLLKPGVAAGDPRSTYYMAWSLKGMGFTDQAADMYSLRARMGGWEEEGWHAEYMAAKLRKDIPGLFKAHARRPHRHEPLSEIARLLDPGEDLLFLENTRG